MILLTILGAALIVAGSLIIAYKGFNLDKGKKIAQVGGAQMKLNIPVYLSPTAGGLMIGAGLFLVMLAYL